MTCYYHLLLFLLSLSKQMFLQSDDTSDTSQHTNHNQRESSVWREEEEEEEEGESWHTAGSCLQTVVLMVVLWSLSASWVRHQSPDCVAAQLMITQRCRVSQQVEDLLRETVYIKLTFCNWTAGSKSLRPRTRKTLPSPVTSRCHTKPTSDGPSASFSVTAPAGNLRLLPNMLHKK